MRRRSSARFNAGLAGRLRLALNVPYALLVLGFVAFDVFETARFGGTVNVPGGVGPGAGEGEMRPPFGGSTCGQHGGGERHLNERGFDHGGQVGGGRDQHGPADADRYVPVGGDQPETGQRMSRLGQLTSRRQRRNHREFPLPRWPGPCLNCMQFGKKGEEP